MKTLSVISGIAFLVTSALAMRAPDDPEEATTWYRQIEDGIKNSSIEKDPIIRIEKLGEYVFKLGCHVRSHEDPRWKQAFKNAQLELLSMPGHAIHFAEEVEREREVAQHAEPATRGLARSKYDSLRDRNFMGILRHVPSPETIRVLGHYLEDEQDAIPARRPAQDYFDTPENAYLALEALSKVGLRDFPVSGPWDAIAAKHTPEWEDVLPRTRIWYAEVKEGKRSFSFKGQNVEYRLKLDGTWETTPLAMSGETLREELKPPASPPSAPRAAAAIAPTIASPVSWTWVVGGAVFLIVAVGGLIWKSRR